MPAGAHEHSLASTFSVYWFHWHHNSVNRNECCSYYISILCTPPLRRPLTAECHRRRSDWNSGRTHGGTNYKSPAVEAKKHIFLHCNASNLVLKILQNDKIWGTIPRSKFWGTCSPVLPVIYAHAECCILHVVGVTSESASSLSHTTKHVYTTYSRKVDALLSVLCFRLPEERRTRIFFSGRSNWHAYSTRCVCLGSALDWTTRCVYCTEHQTRDCAIVNASSCSLSFRAKMM